ncbi:hypothetical protein ASE36_00530 [Rhizobium sp. Root274]|uniref:HEPN domain-containing protein n=1 Tax=unclassified Rhizobium TaxID=2613769 RepID=UPI0007129A8F|nr:MULTISPECIES: HEPN domain-containing protein [unclassified Rhizobium]KQW30824.1 hypothetical protein ASC71_00535 [Rhizobium sp. Root1240]KRD32369.1 hypothetical protein ASE36_00530 [Rhizobium sp. Root274]
MRHAIESRERKLDRFFARARSVEDGELQSDLARYGTVLVCGFVERCVEVIILERLSQKAHPRIIQFLKSHFKRGTNYDCEAICQLLVRFDQDWESQFRSIIDANDEWISSLTSAYAIRNAIAHGGDGNKGLAGVETFYGDSKKIIWSLVKSTEK